MNQYDRVHDRFKVKLPETFKSKVQLSSEPTSLESLIELLNLIRENSISTHSPYFMNQLFSGVLPLMDWVEDLISKTKTTLSTYEASPAFSSIELEVVESLGRIVGWPEGSRDGVAVPGGSAANFMAVHCARHHLFPEIKKRGLTGEKLKIFISDEAHYSFRKACVALGLGTDSLILVPTDQFGRMLPQSLDSLIHEQKTLGATPILVVATAGTTVLGAFDPIDELSSVCSKHQLWLHVDGAWGGPALFSDRTKNLLSGIEKADSITFDAHKLLGAGHTSSLFITQHKGILFEANDVSGGSYLFHGDDPTLDRGRLSWQCGRKADALSFWAIWKSLGTKGIGLRVDRLMRVRDQVLAWIPSQPRIELVREPSYLNLCLRIIPPNQNQDAPDWSKKVREVLKEKNLAMVNYSSDARGSFLRLIFAHSDLKFDHVKQILEWALEVQ